jgi:hypothetical protein
VWPALWDKLCSEGPNLSAPETRCRESQRLRGTTAERAELRGLATSSYEAANGKPKPLKDPTAEEERRSHRGPHHRRERITSSISIAKHGAAVMKAYQRPIARACTSSIRFRSWGLVEVVTCRHTASATRGCSGRTCEGGLGKYAGPCKRFSGFRSENRPHVPDCYTKR